MKIKLEQPNKALQQLIQDPNQLITLDANLLIPPDQNRYGQKGIDFVTFQQIWLDPIFEAFPKLAIHEAVYDEVEVTSSVRRYVDEKINHNPPRLVIHRDQTLTENEKILRNTVEAAIAPLTLYDPQQDNKDDKGEVKSLAYIAVKGLLYFAANDYIALQLIEKAEEWSTGLDNVWPIHIYELIFYLHEKECSDKKMLRKLYRYQYRKPGQDLENNPKWGMFMEKMKEFYDDSLAPR